MRADEEGYLVEEVRDPSGALRWFTVPEVGDGFAEVDLAPAGSVTGVVRDRGDGSPVYGASVVVLGEEGARLASAVTGRDGAYTLQGIPAGEVRLWASYEAFFGDDTSWVQQYFPDARSIADASLVTIQVGDPMIWNPVLGPDMEQDGMDDLWEAEYGLDPEVRDGEETWMAME